MKNYSSGDVYEAIKDTKIGQTSQVKDVRKYIIPHQTLVKNIKIKESIWQRRGQTRLL